MNYRRIILLVAVLFLVSVSFVILSNVSACRCTARNNLLIVSINENLSEDIVTATFYQSLIGKAPVTFIWTTIPYRMEWRYHLAAHKVIAIDAGHVCQNL